LGESSKQVLMFHSKYLDMFLFPMNRGRKLQITAVAVKQPYDHRHC
jgi:hypothetical protein